jgi:hypothetical protein
MLYHHTIWAWSWWIHMLGWDYGAAYGHIIPYDPWSGSISDFGLIAAAGALFTHSVLLWKNHTCPAAWWCWRRPQYQLGDTPHLICGYHHPDHKHTTARQALKLHKERYHHAQSAG